MENKIKMLLAQRDMWLHRCVALEAEVAKLRKLLELYGIDYPKEET